ncbi:MAG: DUF3179 domain-containing protein [Acidimicrobiales bacterium]
MTRRPLYFVAAFAVVLAACSNDDPSEVAADDASLTTSAVDADQPDEPTTTLFTGPTTTFVPPLSGPFDTEGGATFTESPDLIIDPEAVDVLPGTLENLAWPTDWSRRTVENWNEFLAGLRGSDPRDGIPPIDQPIFESVALASEWLGPREPGALVQVDDDVRFYPLSILTRHEIVNDAFGEVPVAVTFCPLCNTALTFDRRIDGQVLRFGVSGLLRNSDLVMWDDQTTSLWQQITGEGVVGTYAGAQLDIIPTSIVSFQQFQQDFPEGRSLSGDSGFGRRAYGANPYTGYSSSLSPFLFNGEIDDRLEALSRVVGISIDDTARAYPFDAVRDAQVVNDTIGEDPVVVWWGGDTADALDGQVIGISAAIGSALALNPIVDGEVLTFTAGVDEGTFVDDSTGSTWSVLGVATDGPLSGTQLDIFPHRNEFWFAYQSFFDVESVWAG